MQTKQQALVVMDRNSFRAHFDEARLARLAELVALADPICVDELDSPAARARMAAVEVLVTSWGAPTLTAERLAAAPALRAVFHAAGSVRSLVTGEVWRRGIRVTNAADANAIPVAEYTIAAIIFAGKKAPFIAADPEAAYQGWGHRDGYGDLSNYRRTVGVVGFSRIGRRVVDLLGCLDSAQCLVADPHADPAEVALAGATLMDLHELLPRSEILSLHAPALPSTYHMIGAAELALLPDHATVINTARGSLVDSEALAAECRSGRLFAILDVTEPEPLPADAALRGAPNVMITPHIAGSLGSEILRLTDHTLDELSRWIAAEPLRAEVTPEALTLHA
ncbi:D-isomer specific 2-hydroxyacid dehydrogenase, NAD-binding [Micromonospora sp. ATCC 39149]|uniref:Hydroxyacid dehydrogenase n=1 Tax=Micromonospora carbonacea TaxID=47853 RepID=A0A7D6CH46_9ACTN|nr:hydroxyacid dehydrogenase [Micromonospora sp. ATCC 39149]EEP69736.1 D-isomer specific 2-hydroxyacid dehydrogenase, NAD-binding [Micromonospora sp. ATCC 39149]QLK01422.1 hydroxyacid dehydrogenase [Micromonospora carbonacea]